MQIEIADEQLECVAEYAQLTGRTVESCIWEAFDDWISVVGQTVSQDQKFNVIGFPEALSG